MTTASSPAPTNPAVRPVNPWPLGLLLVAMATTAFVSHNLLTKVATNEGLSPPVLIFMRSAMIVFVLLIWLRATRQQMRFSLGVAVTLAGLALLNVTNAYTIVFAIGFIPVGLAILLLYLYPVLTPLVSATFGDSKLSTVQMGGAIVAFGGLALALNIWDLQINVVGVVLGIIGAAALALNIVFSARYMRRLPRLSVLLYLVTGMLVFSAVYVIVDTGLTWPHDGNTWLIMVGIMVTYTIAMSSFYMAVDVLTPPRAGLIMNVEPVATIFVAGLLLDETLGGWQYLGAALVIAAVVAVSWQTARAGR